MKHSWKTYGLVMLLFGFLVLIRAFETTLFYDPFLAYFKGNFLETAFPYYDFWKLILNHFFRYILNSSISLWIIYLLFPKKAILKLSLAIYGITFFVLLIAYLWLMNHSISDNYLVLFYVRRFLIQPLFVLILLPAFYYQRLKQKES
ncbi:exosortase F-associated protein [Pustulibacterium marinum]|uniref:Exosortase F-associated protein n=1 Tax=Pustulibacterium marinum TaxID=1224947 RepID=A0A1I7EZE2_9FLAO|nr:exosortase F system-associated protein [Pustulibacterium marinum]SFU29286.1 exosortase F-associated protein [Pustulibacterium marinum]